MKFAPITIYRTDDGEEFDSAVDAERHCELAAYCLALLNSIGRAPCDSDKYTQHDPRRVAEAKFAFLRRVKHLHENIGGLLERYPRVHESHFDRIVSEVTCGDVRRAWYRLSCMDENGREFSQPYFRNHPDEARPQS